MARPFFAATAGWPPTTRGRLCLVFAVVGSAILLGIVYRGPVPIAVGVVGVVLSAGGVLEFMWRTRKFLREERAERDRIARCADNITQSAEKTDTTTTTVGCPNCQHVQTVPRSQPTFVCERCKAHLKRRTAPAKSS